MVGGGVLCSPLQIARTPTPQGYRYDPKMSEKADSGFVGIRNPGCICYMNSLMQQVGTARFASCQPESFAVTRTILG